MGTPRGEAHGPRGDDRPGHDGARLAPGVVLDTNVVFDWLVFRDPAVAALAAAIESGAVRWLACDAMRQELHWVAERERCRPRRDRWSFDRASLMQGWNAWASMTAPPALPPGSRLVCRDASDQVFIDLAIERSARWLVTRDRALLRLAAPARRLGIEVTTAARWRPD